MHAMSSYVQRVGKRRAVVTLVVLGLVLDTIWTGESGGGCKSSLTNNTHSIITTHTGR